MDQTRVLFERQAQTSKLILDGMLGHKDCPGVKFYVQLKGNGPSRTRKDKERIRFDQ